MSLSVQPPLDSAESTRNRLSAIGTNDLLGEWLRLEDAIEISAIDTEVMSLLEAEEVVRGELRLRDPKILPLSASALGLEGAEPSGPHDPQAAPPTAG